MTQNVWNKETNQKFIDNLLLDPYTNAVINAEEVACEFGIRTNSVMSKASELRKEGLLPEVDGTQRDRLRLYTNREDSAIKNMTAQGFSSREIGKELGRTKESVTNRRRTLNIKVKHRWTDDDVRMIKENIKYDAYMIPSNKSELCNLIDSCTRNALSKKLSRLRESGDLPSPLKQGADQAHKDVWYKENNLTFRSRIC